MPGARCLPLQVYWEDVLRLTGRDAEELAGALGLLAQRARQG